MDMECTVYMGREDTERQALNVFRMELLGAKVVAVESGTKTLKDAVNEALRQWTANVNDTYYVLGSVMGPHPYPEMVRDFQSVIGKEVKAQMLEKEGRLPDIVMACVGGGLTLWACFMISFLTKKYSLSAWKQQGAALIRRRRRQPLPAAASVFSTV